VRKQLEVMSYKFGVKESITFHALQIKKVSSINSRLKTYNSKLQLLKGAAI